MNNLEKPPLLGPDAHYHTRRILLGIKNYPEISVYDSYLSYPTGGYVIWPPGYDFVGATIGYLFFGRNASEKTIEWGCAIYPIIWGLLSITLAYLLGSAVCNEKVGLIASLFVALLPCNAWWSALGYNDHHIAEVLTLEVLCYLVIKKSIGKVSDWIVLGAVMGVGMLLWQGAILFAGLLFFVFVITREFNSIYSYITALLIILPFSINTHFVDSPFSYRGLSLLHLILLVIAVLVMAIFFLAQTGSRIFVCLLVIGLAIFLIFLFQEKGFWGGISFIFKRDLWLDTILEFKPLLLLSEVIETITLKSLYGYSYYIWPVGLFMMLFESRRRKLYVFGFFTIVAGIMAFIARRYSVWFSPFYAIILGYIISHIYKLVSKIIKKNWPGIIFSGIIVGIIMMPVVKYGYNKIHWTYHSKESLSAYQWLNDSTPKTSYYFEPTKKPEYGIMCSWSDGHNIIYHGKRPVVLSNFGNDVPNFIYANSFFIAETESLANEIIDSLNCKYIYLSNWQYELKCIAFYLNKSLTEYFDFYSTRDESDMIRRMMVPTIKGYSVAISRLYRFLGSGSYLGNTYFPPYRHYRLRYISGTGLTKIFEYVKGAVIRGRDSPGVSVKISLDVKVMNYNFIYFDSLCADTNGNFEVVLPYATQPDAGYEIKIGKKKTYMLNVSEENIKNGDTLKIK